MRGIRALLAAVIVMGVMILLGTAVLISTVVQRATQRVQLAPAGSPAARIVPTVPLDEPSGTRVALVTRQSDSLLAVTLTGGGLPDRVLLWDPAAARIVARAELAR